MTRRGFLKGMGLVAGGVGAAGAGYNKLVSFIDQPEDVVPGVSTWYATSCRECPAGCGMVVRCREGHAVKCEGNPLHPINEGKLCARGQAALHGLYDPDRISGPKHKTSSGGFESIGWDDAIGAVSETLRSSKKTAIMTDLQTGSLDSLMRSWLSAFGSEKLLVYEPINYESVRATNKGVVLFYDIAKSDCLIAFGCDFLETWVSPVEYARAFAEMRQVKNGKRGKFIYIGPRVSMTATNADLRIVAPPGTSEDIARALISGGTQLDDVSRRLNINRDDLLSARRAIMSAKKPLAMPGFDTDSARATLLVNTSLGVSLVDVKRPHAVSNIASNNEVESFLIEMENGSIDCLLIHGANPVFSYPDSERFIDALKKVKTVISLSSYSDETSTCMDWILPSNTALESWGDYFPYPNVGNLMQPAMGNVFDTKDTGDILFALADKAGIDTKMQFKAAGYQKYLKKRWTPTGNEADWESLLQKGGKWSGISARESTPVTGYEVLDPVDPKTENSGLRLWAFPHIYYYDGRNANRWWLQETPEPVVKTVWDSWAEINPKTASELGVETDDVIEIETGNAKIRVSVYVWNGVADNTIAVPIGEGHTQYGRFASGVGVNVYPLLKSETPTVRASATGGNKWVTRIKGDTDQHHREIVQIVRLDSTFERKTPIIMPLSSGYTKKDFYPGHPHKEHRWAMVVDLDRCIGCSACVTACYAENNIGIVGADQIWSRRHMAWIRIDRYIDWKSKDTPLVFQPMLCQQCDAAPCEPVCPVYAASHSDEGLNMQVYNRCVGTRYCSNNCPYKVRRFNWTDYKWPEPLNWQLNPDVTVRCRGVMEKCTFCIQRINEAEIAADREGRELHDGEITPACAQTCPTGVFTFGDLKDPDSKVSKLVREDPRAYQVLSELNTKPAVIYLKRITEVL